MFLWPDAWIRWVLSIKGLSSSIEIHHLIILDPWHPHHIPNLPSQILIVSLPNPPKILVIITPIFVIIPNTRPSKMCPWYTAKFIQVWILDKCQFTLQLAFQMLFNTLFTNHPKYTWSTLNAYLTTIILPFLATVLKHHPTLESEVSSPWWYSRLSSSFQIHTTTSLQMFSSVLRHPIRKPSHMLNQH